MNCLNQFNLASVYCHSTETALLQVTNDLLLSADSGHLSILLLLDLTWAIDTINNNIFLSRLKYSINITGTAPSWFKSYLSDRQQYIIIDNYTLSTAPITRVPHGSMLGALFIFYMFHLGNIMCHHGLYFHYYAKNIFTFLGYLHWLPQIVKLFYWTKSMNGLANKTLTNLTLSLSSLNPSPKNPHYWQLLSIPFYQHPKSLESS